MIGYQLAGGSGKPCPYQEQDECDPFPPGFGGLLVGFGLGLVAASVIDIGFLAYDRPKGTPIASMTLAPIIVPQRDVAGLSVSSFW